jgi:beta-lactamase class D
MLNFLQNEILMVCRLVSTLIIWSLCIFQCTHVFSAEENFLLINGVTDEIVLELGLHINERISPYSTFKITLSLIGYDVGILKDEKTPTWDFQEGYDDFLELWKGPQTPQSWMKYSCVWYSKVLALQLGLEKIQNYLTSIEYGNEDMSGGLAQPGPTNVAWINSSLKISPKEQVNFIQKMIRGQLPISPNSIQMTKLLLFKEESPDGWKLFGRTGYGWFVGWIEKDHNFFPFAYHICEQKINPDQRIQRVKQLLLESNIIVTDFVL